MQAGSLMVKQLQTNTYVLLQNAADNGGSYRDFIWISGKNRSTGATESLGLWNGWVPVTADVVNPKTGETVSRVYQAGGGLIGLPEIPATLQTEVRSIRVQISHLSEAAMNAIRLYNAQMAEVQIHRGVFDPSTGAIADPALCRFFGYVNHAPIPTPASGEEGAIELECVSASRLMTRKSGKLTSPELFKERYKSSGATDMFGKYLDVAGAWRVWWGQSEEAVGKKSTKVEKWLKLR
jgi:hypothetical protein